MSTLTIELPEALAARLAAASERKHVPLAQIIRESLERTLPIPAAGSAKGRTLHDAFSEAGAIGCIASGVPDLATNPSYMEGFGKCRD